MTTKKGFVVAQRFHDISCGHRVYGHESKCAHLHGHNYRIHFNVIMGNGSEVDSLGRVLDFSILKSSLCMWLEDNWDHRFLMWDRDPALATMKALDPTGVVPTTFNPTAENMAEYLVEIVGPYLLASLSCRLVAVKIEETYKCHATYFGNPDNNPIPFTD